MNKKRKEEEIIQKEKVDKLSFTKEINVNVLLCENKAVAPNIEKNEQKDMII